MLRRVLIPGMVILAGAVSLSGQNFWFTVSTPEPANHTFHVTMRSEGLAGETQDFKMPVQNNLLNYRRQLLGMMRAAPSYRHPDVFADMMRAVDRAGQRHGRQSLQLICPDSESSR